MLDIPFEPTQDKSFSQKKSCIYLKIKCGKDFLGLSQRLNHYYSYIYIYIYICIIYSDQWGKALSHSSLYISRFWRCSPSYSIYISNTLATH